MKVRPLALSSSKQLLLLLLKTERGCVPLRSGTVVIDM